MYDFRSYFTPQKIIKLLCKYRIKHARKRHKLHLIRDISLHEYSLSNFKTLHRCPPELERIMPPRKEWQRLKESDRKHFNNSDAINIESLYRTINTTYIRVKNEEISPPNWYNELVKFIKDVQDSVNINGYYAVGKPITIPVRKDIKGKTPACRPISNYNMKDRIVIGLTAKYLVNISDNLFCDSSFAFRSTINKTISHHDAVREIKKFRKKHKDCQIWVAECDIKKFFDCINHKSILVAYGLLEDALKEFKVNVNPSATRILKDYLLSYAFTRDVLALNGTDYFTNHRIPGGYFDWPAEIKTFYENIDIEDIGIPQGGALSCFIANLILHTVDKSLEEYKSVDFRYLRFCDDMVMMSSDKETCEKALSEYQNQLTLLKLAIHNPKKIDQYSAGFWEEKSKKPYQWGGANKNGCIPWLSFVGYQIRFDGLIRIRKKSIEKQLLKQDFEVREVLKAVYSKDKNSLNINSRKSLKQQVIALESRLVAMSVGRIKLYNLRGYEPALCWTNGFKELFENSISKRQLRYLDKRRSKSIYDFKIELSSLTKASDDPDNGVKQKFFGSPFSYYFFLKLRRKF